MDSNRWPLRPPMHLVCPLATHLLPPAATTDQRERGNVARVGEEEDLRRRDHGYFDEEASPPRSSSHLASRSEEHTSELQSLRRISDAVFCLKKKFF